MYGVRKLFVAGLLIYGGGSFMGLLAQAYFPAVIFARFVQGSGALYPRLSWSSSRAMSVRRAGAKHSALSDHWWQWARE